MVEYGNLQEVEIGGNACLSIAISGSRDIPDRRLDAARKNNIREWWYKHGGDPLNERLECPLGRLRLGGFLSEKEYEAGCKWRTIYRNWLEAIEAPSDLSDEKAESYEQAFRVGQSALMKLGRRIFDAVNAVAVYEEPEELGEFYFTARSAKIGFTELASIFS